MTKKTEKIAILTGNDDVSKYLLSKVLAECVCLDHITLLLDNSLKFKRIYRLLVKRKITISWLLSSLLTQYMQLFFLLKFRDPKLPLTLKTLKVNSNTDLENFFAKNLDIKKLYCFRAGIIISKNNVKRINCVNIHCARIPDYAGLMSIKKALRNKDYCQSSVLHKVTEKIDGGEILRQENYTIDPKLPYWKVDFNAYRAGAKLLLRELNDSSH